MARLCLTLIGIDAVLKAVPHSAFDVNVALDIDCTVALWSGSILPYW
jgi:hypothetical protein